MAPPSKKTKTSEIESKYKTTVTYICPKRGKVTEEVVVIKYKPQEVPEDKSADPLISELIRSAADDLEDD